MKRLRRLLALLLVLMALLPQALAQTFTLMGLEDAGMNRKWADNRFFQHMAEKTGIDFQFRQYSDPASYQEALLNLKQDAPDLLFKAALSPAMAIRLLEEGVLIDLAPYLQAHCPNLSALMTERPDIRRAITLPGGQIAALPFVETAPAQNALWINKAWLDELKLGLPQNHEELEQALQAFKDKDPNRNGKRDEIPLSFLGAYDLKYLAHAFGLAANDFNLFVKEGQAAFMPLEEDFWAFLSWCRALYQGGLLNKNGFSTLDAFRRVSDAKATRVLGAFFAPLPGFLVPMEWVDDYVALPPMVYEGRQVYRSIAPAVVTGTFAVTTACQDVPAILRWVDALYAPEGAILAAIGKEGQDYVVDGDGSWRSLPGIQDTAYQANGIISTGTAIPGVSSDAFQRRYGDPLVGQLSGQVDQVRAVAADPFPAFSLTEAEEQRIAPLQAAIGRHVDEGIARFVLGERALTQEEITEFKAELEALGLPAFMAFWQEILERGESK